MENFTSEKDRALWSAASSGDAVEVKKALKEGADANATNYLGMTPLMALLDASEMINPAAQLKIAKLLIGAGSEVNTISGLGQSPMSLAIENGRFSLVKYLHESGADLGIATDNGDNYIYKAVDSYDGSKNYIKIIEYLMENGVDADAVRRDNGQTALFRAVDLQALPVVKLLTGKGKADVNRKDIWGLSPIHYACREASANIVKVLVEAGADPNAQDEYGFTPLHEAVLNDRKLVINYLIEKVGVDKKLGLTADFEDFSKGDTPYDIAVKTNKSLPLQIALM